MATTTPHYSLRKPDGADRVNVVTDLDANMTLIDTALFETAEAVGGIEGLPAPIGDIGEAVVVSGTDQVTSLTLSNGSANGGTFFLIVNGNPTSSIPWDVVADDLGSPIRDILGDETTSVAGGPLSSGFQITFVGPVGGFVVTVAADASGLTGPDAPYDITATDLQSASPHVAGWGVSIPDLFAYSGSQVHLTATDGAAAEVSLIAPDAGAVISMTRSIGEESFTLQEDNVAITSNSVGGSVDIFATNGVINLISESATIQTASGFTFSGTTQTGVAVSAAAIHAALVALGLITA